MSDTPVRKWRPEEINFAKGGLVIGGVAGAALIVKFLPQIIAVLSNTVHAAILLGVLGVLAVVLLNPKTWQLVSTVYMQMMSKITRMIIDLDPISILQNHIIELKKNYDEFKRHIGELRGAKEGVQRKINEYSTIIEKEKRLADKAKGNGDNQSYAIHARECGRKVESLGKLEALNKKLEMMYNVFGKMATNCEFLITDTENEVNHRKTEWESIKKAYAAMSSAKKVLDGDKDKIALFNQTMEFLEEDMSQKLGEMQSFLDMSTKIMSQIDLENEVFADQGIAMFEEWEKKSDSLLLSEKDKRELGLLSVTPNHTTSTLNYAEMLNS